jgi:hypothetical protein
MEIFQLMQAAIVMAIIIIIFLAIKAYRLNKKIEILKNLRQTDISETNKLFIEKSENELRLFFQFETVLEEMVKILRKTEGQNTELVEGQKDIKLLLEITLKK